MEQLPPHNMLDIILLVIMALGLVQGIRRGLSGEVARLLGTVLAAWAGWFFYRPMGLRIQQKTLLTEQEAYATAFILSLIVVFILFLLLRLILGKIMEVTFKGQLLERLGGALAGFLRTATACAALLFFLHLLPSQFIRESVEVHSFFGRLVTRHAPEIWQSVRTVFPDAPDLPQPLESESPIEEPAPFDPSREIPAVSEEIR